MVVVTDKHRERYRQLRSGHDDLLQIMLRRLPDHVVVETGKRLGVFADNSLVFNSEREMSTVMDYCIHDYRLDGQSIIEQYLKDTAVDPKSDHGVLLAAMVRSRYSVFAIKRVLTAWGIEVQDLLRGNRDFIMDFGLGETAMENFVIAGRTISPAEYPFSMTSGGVLPCTRDALGTIGEVVPSRFGATGMEIEALTPEKKSELSAFLIKTVCRALRSQSEDTTWER